jgi:nucleoid DNA-binding protein
MAVKKTAKRSAKRKGAAKSKRKTSKKSCKKRKRTMAAKKAAAPKSKKISFELAKKPYTKGELQRTIAAYAGITKKQVGDVFIALEKIIANHLKKSAVGLLKLEGLMKIERIFKPAKKARKGINPFTGEEMMFKAKPAHHVIKVRALKKLKEMV